MSILLQINPFEFFADLSGDALDEGYIYIGEPNKDPRQFPVAVFYDEALTIPAVQPLRTMNGFVVRNGTPAFLFVNGNYSILVQDKNRRQVYYVSDFLMIGNSSAVSTNDLANTSDPSKGDALVGVKQPGANSVARTQHTQNAEFLTVSAYATPADAASAAAGLRLFIGPGETVTVNVPADQPTISAAMSAIRNWVIAKGGAVIVKVAAGTYNITASVDLNHPYGEGLQVIGDPVMPSACVIMGPSNPTFDAFVVSNGHRLGRLAGFKFDLPTKADIAHNFSAVFAVDGGVIICDDDSIITNNWYYGLHSRDGSVLKAQGANVSNAGDVGAWAFGGAVGIYNRGVFTNCADAANNLGYGVQAEFGSTVFADDCVATGNHRAGIASLSNSMVIARNSQANSNVGSGFFTMAGGQIESGGTSTANNNGRYGIEVLDYGYATGVGTITGNTLGAVNRFAFTGSVAGRASISASNGPLDHFSEGANGQFFSTGGGLQFEVQHVASAGNHTYARGGQAGVGVACAIGAAGVDPNIDMAVLPQGTGWVQLGAGFNAMGAIPVTGYIEIKDSAGVVRRLLVG